MAEDPVVMALRAALASSDQPAIRTALAQHLLRLDRAAEALVELEAALVHDAADPAVLEAAAEAARRSGDAGKATAYSMAHAAITGAAAPAPTAAPEPPPEAPSAPALAAVPALGPATGPDDPVDAALDEPAQADGPTYLRLVIDGDLDIEAPSLSFEDVGGLDDVKQRLQRSFLMPMQRPGLFKRFGKKVGGGLLMYGPPGCGKTFLARALAGEIGARFLSIGLSDVLDMWLGESERKLHELFETARRQTPVVLFFDEVDALGQRRSQLRHSAGRNIVNQLLSEMDGVASDNEGLFVLGATNQPWDLDPAMRRPGRFDRTVFVPPPDPVARARILELKLADRPTVARLDINAVAKRTDGFSGADLQSLVDGATELAITRSLESGDDVPIDSAMLEQSRQEMRPSTRPWLESARNYALYANEGGSWDDLLAYLKRVGLA
jgi:SpoVK/Ycf46/Vps4 family AAA+-type ATPase